MPSDLERAMETLITVFHRYAGKEGNSNTLSRRELRQLMEAELASFLKVMRFFFLSLLLFITCFPALCLNSYIVTSEQKFVSTLLMILHMTNK